jgi:uncharacterized membrane protein
VENRYRPKSLNTDFNRVFRDLGERYKEKSLQGVMLFSDGADLVQEPGEISPELSETLASLTGPVHTFQAGSNEQFKDLAIEGLEVSDFGFVHQPVELTVTVSAFAMGSRNVPLVLKEGDKIVVSKVVPVTEQKERYTVSLQFTPVMEGRKVYSLSVPLFAGESIESNNERSFQVNVVRDRIRVLHLNGRPSWDSRFLREALAGNPKVDLLSFFILRTLSDDVQAQTAELSLIPFPSNLLFSDYLSSFDLVVFHNFRFSPFIEKKNLDNVRKYVQEGGAFLMIGGELSFQGGDYQRTAVEDILPVRMERQANRVLMDEFRMKVSETYRHHPVLRLEKDEALNREAWKAMPPLNGVNVGLVPVEAAQVLAGYEPDAGGPLVPVLVAGRAGQGRSMAVATDTSWNWNFLRVGEGGSGRYYQKFWENVIAWLTNAPETHLIQVESDKETYQEEEPVLITFQVRKEDYNPSPGTKVSLRLTLELGDREVGQYDLVSDENGEGRYEFTPQEEGFYTARIVRDVGGQDAVGQTGFRVFSPTTEFRKPRVNPGLLKTFAEVTGGTYRLLDQGTRLEGLQFPNPRVEVKIRSRTVSLWDNWLFYGLVLGCLFMEWWLRRKSGLS